MTGLDLGTCSYAAWSAALGVPVRTSIGRHRAFHDIAKASAVMPWGIFGKMDDEPDEVAAAAYFDSLDRREDRVWSELRRLAEDHDGERLVLLCYEDLSKVGPNGCHRRWFAEWAGRRGLEVPELSTPA